MIAGNWLPEARKVLVGSRVKLAAAIDFPLNQMTTAGKAAEARALVEAGAQRSTCCEYRLAAEWHGARVPG